MEWGQEMGGGKKNGDIDEGRKEVPEMNCLFTALPRTQGGLFHQWLALGPLKSSRHLVFMDDGSNFTTSTLVTLYNENFKDDL